MKKMTSKSNKMLDMKSHEIKVKDIMKKDVIKVFNFFKLDEAARIMIENNIGCLIVFKNNNIVGIITERDFVRGIGKKIDPTKSTVEDIMTSPLIYISPDVTIEQAAKKMATLNIRRLPIVEKLDLIGIITEKDLIKIAPELIYISRSLKDIRYSEDFQEFRTKPGYCEDCESFSYGLGMKDGKLMCEQCVDFSGE
jgi:CBS domain-containing protein